jgi:hypothetical protein
MMQQVDGHLSIFGTFCLGKTLFSKYSEDSIWGANLLTLISCPLYEKCRCDVYSRC